VPAGTPVAGGDHAASRALAALIAAGAPTPSVVLTAGDLFTTVGGRARNMAAAPARAAAAFPIDLGEVEVDGEPHLFVAHTVAHSRWWTTAVAAMNAQWLGGWNVAPRAHPNDGRLDVVEARLTLRDLRQVRARLGTGTHLPHPRIRERRAASVELVLPRPLPVWVDGVRVAARATRLSFRIRPDAARVLV